MRTKKLISLTIILSVIMTLFTTPVFVASAETVGSVSIYAQEWQMGTWAMSNMIVDESGEIRQASFVNERGNLEITSFSGMSHDPVWAQFPYSVNEDGSISMNDTENKLTMLDDANFDIDFRMRYDGRIHFMTQFYTGAVRIDFKDNRMTVDDGNYGYKTVKINDDNDWHNYTVSVRGRNARGAQNTSPDNVRFVRIYMDGKEVYSLHTTRYPAAYRTCRFYAVNDFEQISHAEIESIKITNYATDVKITSHRAGDILTAGQDVTLTANAGAASGESKNVDFYVNGIKVGSGTNQGETTTTTEGGSGGCEGGGSTTTTTPAKDATITLSALPAGTYTVKAISDGVESAEVILFVKNTRTAEINVPERVNWGERITLGVTTSGYPQSQKAEYYVNGNYVGEALTGSTFSADSSVLPVGTTSAYAKVYATDGSFVYTDAKTFNVPKGSASNTEFNREYRVDYTVADNGQISVKDGYFELDLTHSGDKVTYKNENGTSKEYDGELGTGEYRIVVTSGNAELYYNGQFAFAFLMPQCYDSQSVDHSGVENFVIDSSGVKATYFHKELGTEESFIEYLPVIGNYFSLEYDKKDLSHENLVFYDGLYEIAVNMDDSGIWVNRQPTVGEPTERYQITDAVETGYYRVTVAEGMAQISLNNKVIGTWRSPLSAHSPMISRKLANPLSTTFVAVKGIDDVYYHSEDFEGNIESGFTAEDYWFDETDMLIEDEATEAAYKHQVVTKDENSYVEMTGEGTYFLNAISYNPSFKWRGKFEGADGGFSVRFREAMKYDFSDMGYDAQSGQWFARNSAKTKNTDESGKAYYESGFTELATASGNLTEGWHDFELVLNGDRGTLLCDGAEVISAQGFRNSYGKTGFEVRGSDSVFAFDDVEYSGEGKATAGMSYFTDGRADFYHNFKGQLINATAESNKSWYYSEDNGVTWTEAVSEEGRYMGARGSNNLNLLSGKFLRIRYSGKYTYAHLYDENTYADDKTIVSGTEYTPTPSATTPYCVRVEPEGSMDNVPFSEVPSRLMQIQTGPYKGRVIYCRGGGGEIYGTVYMYWSDDYDGIDDPAPNKAVWHPAEIQLSYFNVGEDIQESIAVDMPDGTLRYYVRTEMGHIAYFTSADGGETWDKPIEMTMENLLSPLACYSIQRKGDTNTYYAFWEYDLVTANLTYLESPRNRRALAVSYDGMETWEYVADIEEERQTASCTSKACNYGARYINGAVYMAYYMENIHDKVFRIDETKIKPLKRFTAPHYRTQLYSTVRDFYDRNCVIGKAGGDSYLYGGYINTHVNENGLVTAEVVAKAVGAQYAQSENGATLTFGGMVVTFTNGESGYSINDAFVATDDICYESGFLNVPLLAKIFGKNVAESDYSYIISDKAYETYVQNEIEGAGIHYSTADARVSVLLTEINAESRAGNGEGIRSVMDRYAYLIGFTPDVSEVRYGEEVFARMTGIEYICISDIKVEFDKALEAQKQYEKENPYSKTYSFSYGTTYLSSETAVLPDAKKYDPASVKVTDNKYTTLTPEATTDNPRSYVVTFDAKNTVQGLPLLVHIGANVACQGITICPTDIIGTDWYSYKFVVTETAGDIYLKTEAYRKPCGSDVKYERIPIAAKYSYKSGDQMWQYGSRSNAKNIVRFMYDCYVEAAAMPDTDPYATVWEVKNLQVTDAVTIEGNVTETDDTISVDARLTTATTDADVILGVYDNDDRMTDNDLRKFISGEGDVELTAEYGKDRNAVLFVWDRSKNQAPLIKPIDLIEVGTE